MLTPFSFPASSYLKIGVEYSGRVTTSKGILLNSSVNIVVHLCQFKVSLLGVLAEL